MFEIYERHAKASEAAINVAKTQIFKLGEQNVPTKLEHDDFTKKVKNKVTVLGAVFCSDKSQETFESLQKATKALEKLQNGHGKFLILAGKILALNTYVFSTVWNKAWLIDIKNSHFKKFICNIERYLCLYKGNKIMEKVSTEEDLASLILKRGFKPYRHLNISTNARSDNIKIRQVYQECVTFYSTFNRLFFGKSLVFFNSILQLCSQSFCWLVFFGHSVFNHFV